MTSFWSKVMAGAAAFKEAYVTSGYGDDLDFESYEGRILRYQILWAMYESNLGVWARFTT